MSYYLSDPCPSDSCYTDQQYKRMASSFYSYLDIARCRCQKECDKDVRCNGYSTYTYINGCFLSNCNTSTDSLYGSHYFVSKIIPTSNVSCPPVSTTTITTTLAQAHLTTVEHRSTMVHHTTELHSTTIKQPTTVRGSTTITSSLKSVTTNDTTQIIMNSISCVCKYENHTMEESMEKRRRYLILNKTELSSNIRKRTSAHN